MRSAGRHTKNNCPFPSRLGCFPAQLSPDVPTASILRIPDFLVLESTLGGARNRSSLVDWWLDLRDDWQREVQADEGFGRNGTLKLQGTQTAAHPQFCAAHRTLC